jgi:hypothetical protein
MSSQRPLNPVPAKDGDRKFKLRHYPLVAWLSRRRAPDQTKQAADDRGFGEFRYNVTNGTHPKRNSKLKLIQLLALIEPIICKEFARTLAVWRTDDE